MVMLSMAGLVVCPVDSVFIGAYDALRRMLIKGICKSFNKSMGGFYLVSGRLDIGIVPVWLLCRAWLCVACADCAGGVVLKIAYINSVLHNK